MNELEKAENLLVVYDFFGDIPTVFYLINKKKFPDIWDFVIQSEGIYINSTNQTDACDKFNEWLNENDESCIFDYSKDLIPNNTMIIKTGFIC